MLDRSSMNWLGIEDFFNYYLPGVLWSINIMGAIATVDTNFADILITKFNNANQLILIGLAVFIPYIIGIITGFVCTAVHDIDKKILGLPEEYVVDSDKRKAMGSRKLGSSLGEGFAKKVKKIAAKKFGSDISANSLYQNVHYSLQFSSFSRVQTHIARITNLMNLHEALVTPVFVTALLLFLNATRLHLMGLNALGAILLFTFFGLWGRYHYLRETRAKQVYRYFYLWQTNGQKIASKE